MRVLDLFCGAGGAAMGLHRAWPDAEIIGVDNKWQPRYPFTFVLADAMTFPLEGYDFIWASPPCQLHSTMTKVWPSRGKHFPECVGPTRSRLVSVSTPWVIENVNGAPLGYAIQLCGRSFGLGVIRHRRFESNVPLLAPTHMGHRGFRHLSVVGHGGPANQRRWKVAQAREAMGISWMTREELVEAVPPAYSEFIAKQVPLNRR